MDRRQSTDTNDSDELYSLRFMPKESTALVTSCDTESEDEFIDVQNETTYENDHQSGPGHATDEQHITQNVYNNETEHYSLAEDTEHNRQNRTHDTQNTEINYNLYEEDKIECRAFLSQLPEDITNNENILVNDPMFACWGNDELENELTIEEAYSPPNSHLIFDQITAFEEYMIANHTVVSSDQNIKLGGSYWCSECMKSFNDQDKFELHCLSHGDPDLVCNVCHKAFASKFSLRCHSKIHARKYACHICYKPYGTTDELKRHMESAHKYYLCHSCSFVANKFSDLMRHQRVHLESAYTNPPSPESHGSQSRNNTESNNVTVPHHDQVRDADSVIAKVMSNKIFLLDAKKGTKRRLIKNKDCNICLKKFKRISDLKRHLIEHIIKSTLSKTPVSHEGTRALECEVCHEHIFFIADQYKAHLREHANLTFYKCTFCHKLLSDSSNFSKHMKIHNSTFFECDICHKKFKSKKWFIQHIKLHHKNSPKKCHFCNKIFKLKSMLNKHICTHNK